MWRGANRGTAIRLFETTAALRVAALLVATTVLGSVLLGPVLAHCKRPEAISMYAAFSSVCHQQPERCWWLLDYPLAVCVRCLGFYVGAIAALLAGWRFWGPAFVLAALSVLATWLGEWSGLMPFTPWLWFVTGFSLGSTCVAALSDTACWWKRPEIRPRVDSMSAGAPTGPSCSVHHFVNTVTKAGRLRGRHESHPCGWA